MSNNLTWLEHKGKEILFNDRSNLRNEDLIANVETAVRTIKNSGKRNILYLIDNTNTIITTEVKEAIKKGGKELKPYLQKTAVVGTSASQKILLNVLSSITSLSIKVFDTLDEGKEWLIK